LHPCMINYYIDCISWGAIGARTTESMLHRQLVSSLDIPVAFKNTTSGSIKAAAAAVVAANHPGINILPDKMGDLKAVMTTGNLDAHIVLRGGSAGPNYFMADIMEASRILRDTNASCHSVIVDCSHDNSSCAGVTQLEAARYLQQHIKTVACLAGLMLESNLYAGRQDNLPGKTLRHGVSITDACMSWQDSEDFILNLADVL
jgi:3-deoxy-7-phosphoheptulonate synthase